MHHVQSMAPNIAACPVSYLERLLSSSDPFEKTLKATCLGSDHDQCCLIREKRGAYAAYTGVDFSGP